jgi:hypothetical protein
MSVVPGDSGLNVFVPCFHDGSAIRHTYAEIVDALGDVSNLEILLIDDGSRDDTLTHIKALAAADPRVRYLAFSRNYGLEAAQAAGFRYASKPWTAQLDSDLQNPPEEIWKLLADLRLGSPYLIAMVPLIGARYTCVPTLHRADRGRSRWRLSRLVGHSFELLFGYSWRPLDGGYLVALLGVLAAVTVAGLGLGGLVGQPAVGMTALLLTAVTLALVALLGRYLYRLMLDERRTRPDTDSAEATLAAALRTLQINVVPANGSTPAGVASPAATVRQPSRPGASIVEGAAHGS